MQPIFFGATHRRQKTQGPPGMKKGDKLLRAPILFLNVKKKFTQSVIIKEVPTNDSYCTIQHIGKTCPWHHKVLGCLGVKTDAPFNPVLAQLVECTA